MSDAKGVKQLEAMGITIQELNLLFSSFIKESFH